ncbi:MAG: 50S ribosomal protein L16 [Candidatus Aenigmarchaeota archaeon]|nr:50S ribosomal protein L16 [Candidatus Aenigmarchaeota archaeon]
MGLRPGRCTRKIKRPYTRVSKKKSKNYVGTKPPLRIHIFEMGNKKKDFEKTMHLIGKRAVQIRDNALEASRVNANKFLEKKITPENYFMKILVYPHQILREHTLATGAGADRFSMGMRKSFGRPKGRAAVVDKGQKIITLKLDKKNLKFGKRALERASDKLPTPCRIVIE